MLGKEVKEAVKLHGHLCFGLCVGLAASRFAMENLGVERAKGEELVVIAENNSCAVDAIQIVAGATSGRGNLIIKDWGKHAYTFATRKDGRAIRVSLRYDVFAGIKDRKKRMKKLMDIEASEAFKLKEVKIDLPPEAEVVKSVQCSSCKEPVMETRTRLIDGGRYCTSCYEKVYIEPSGIETQRD